MVLMLSPSDVVDSNRMLARIGRSTDIMEHTNNVPTIRMKMTTHRLGKTILHACWSKFLASLQNRLTTRLNGRLLKQPVSIQLEGRIGRPMGFSMQISTGLSYYYVAVAYLSI